MAVWVWGKEDGIFGVMAAGKVIGAAVSVTYRPASTASMDTAATTASVDINFKPNGNAINGGKPVKLKFPQQGGQ